MHDEVITFVEGSPRVGRGSAGLLSQAPGSPVTVGAVALRSGGIGRGHLIDTDNG